MNISPGRSTNESKVDGSSPSTPHEQHNSNEVELVSEAKPNRRGTLSILFSCVSTLLLCSWSVMHLNVPRKGSSYVMTFRSYGYWCFIGVFGPELVIWAAWRQFISAKALMDEMKHEGILPHNWTLSHGFYAVMGGFAFDTAESFPHEPQPFTSAIDRISITPKGMRLLARCSHLPSLSGEEIADKSKMDELGKLLACVQATWLIVQICTRLVVHLPVTLLEVSTASHVLCALIIYGLWWHKPRKVCEPTVLRGAWTGPLAAFMIMSSQLGQDQALPEFRMAGDSCEISQLKFIADSHDEAPHSDERLDRTKDCQQRKHTRQFRIRAKCRLPQLGQTDADRELLDEDDDPQSRLTRTRWLLACKAVEQYPAVRQMLRAPVTEHERRVSDALKAYPEMPEKFRRVYDEEKTTRPSITWWECGPQNLVTANASNWPHDGLLRTTGGLVVGATLWIASIAFTAVYIAAWKADFPSEVEAWFWRSSALYIVFSGLLWASLHILAETWAKLWWAWYDVMNGSASRLMMGWVIAVCSVCGFLYVAARMFLIVEAFICLRSLTAASYEVPSWTIGFPHVG